MATDDDDAATLRERVRDLEQTVAQQQDTIQQLLPSRRAVLAGGAGLVGGVALTGQASAQSAAGQVGTSSEPVDVEAFDVTVQNGLDMADNTISNVNGLTASSAVIGGTVTATDVNTDSVNTDSASVTNQLDAGSVNTDSASVTNQLDAGSVNTDQETVADVVTVGPNEDVATVVSDNAGKVIDLAGQTLSSAEEVTLPANTTIRNGTIVSESGGTYPNSALIYSSGADSPIVENIKTDCTETGGVHGIRYDEPINAQIRNPRHRGGKWGIVTQGRNTNESEGEGTLIVNPRIKGAGTGGIISIGHDYVNIVGGNIFDCPTGIKVSADNISATGAHVNNCGQGVEIQNGKCKLNALTVNHCDDGILAVGSQRHQIDGCQLLVNGGDGIKFDGVQHATVSDCSFGQNAGSAIYLKSSSGTTEQNQIHGNALEVYDGGDASTPVGIAEADDGTQGNSIKNTDAANVTSTPFDLNSGDVEANTPRVGFDAAPATTENGRVILATSTWDPNSTGGDSLVVTNDGGSSFTTVTTL